MKLSYKTYLIIPVLVGLVLVFYFKPDFLNIATSCENFTQDYYVTETVNRPPNYLTNSTFSRSVGANSTTFIGKVNITNLENIAIRFFVNYTFHVIELNATRDDKFYINTSISPNNSEIIPFFTYGGQGSETTGSYIITVANISVLENVTKTNTTQRCF